MVFKVCSMQVWIQQAEPAKSAIISKPPELKKDLIDVSANFIELILWMMESVTLAHKAEQFKFFSSSRN